MWCSWFKARRGYGMPGLRLGARKQLPRPLLLGVGRTCPHVITGDEVIYPAGTLFWSGAHTPDRRRYPRSLSVLTPFMMKEHGFRYAYRIPDVGSAGGAVIGPVSHAGRRCALQPGGLPVALQIGPPCVDARCCSASGGWGDSVVCCISPADGRFSNRRRRCPSRAGGTRRPVGSS